MYFGHFLGTVERNRQSQRSLHIPSEVLDPLSIMYQPYEFYSTLNNIKTNAKIFYFISIANFQVTLLSFFEFPYSNLKCVNHPVK